MKKWNSFLVKSPTEIEHTASFPMEHDPKASQADTKTRAIFVLAGKKPPYNVYGNPFYDHAGSGNVFSVNEQGSLEKNVQNYDYCPQTAIHGMVFDPTETYLYSADMWANRVWCHKKDPESGHMTTVGSVDAPAAGDHPRWVEMAPSGKYLYALMEGGNRLGVYSIDEETHMPVYTNKIYPLVPPGKKRLLFSDLKAQTTDTKIRPSRDLPQDVPLRRRIPLFQRQIPVCDIQIEFSRLDWIHCRFQAV
jgi:carboxy-cis,cis-muconate cyclase